MATYFIVGASRGIGFELVNQIINTTNAGNKVIAGVRNPSSATALHDLQKVNSSRLSIVQIDLESDQSVKVNLQRRIK
jgi:NAD(P)-dependent dehydrogenase (short-subunit alcohol dehydrogenase family)